MSEDRANGFLFEEEQYEGYISFLFPPADVPAGETPQVSSSEDMTRSRRVFGAAAEDKAGTAEKPVPGAEQEKTAPSAEDDFFAEDLGTEESGTSEAKEAADEVVDTPKTDGFVTGSADENDSQPVEAEPANAEQDGDDNDLRVDTLNENSIADKEEIKIHYLEAGIGEPLLLIHGIGQSVYTWRNVFEVLSENYRVIAIDLPGHGKSSRPETFSYSMDEMAEMLHEFMLAKGIESAHMVGFSTGAVYMMRLLTLYPESVANCIAIAPGGISKCMPKVFLQMKKTVTGVFARNFYGERTVADILENAVATENFFTDADISRYYEPISDGLTREALMYAVMNFDLKGTVEELRESDHEILCIWGREDTMHPVSGSVYFEKNLSYGRFYLIRGAGHLVQEEYPDKILNVILSYIPSVVTGNDRYPYPESR